MYYIICQDVQLAENIVCQNTPLFSIKDKQNPWESCILMGSGKLSLNVHKTIKSSIWNRSSMAELMGSQKRTRVCSLHVLLHSEGWREAAATTGPAASIMHHPFTESLVRAQHWDGSCLGGAGVAGERSAFQNTCVLSWLWMQKKLKQKNTTKQKTRRREEGCSGQKSGKPLYGLYFAFYLKSSLEQQPALWLNHVPRASRRHGTGGLPARCARCWALCSGPSSSWQLLCENWGCINSS